MTVQIRRRFEVSGAIGVACSFEHFSLALIATVFALFVLAELLGLSSFISPISENSD
jgi:uncharacterized membrane protein YhiD involved in acid resistance